MSIIQAIDNPFWVNRGVSPISTHMNIRVLSKTDKAIEPLAFHRGITLLRTDRDHEQKTCASSIICTFLVVVSRSWVFGTFPMYPLYLSSIFLCAALCIKAPESTTNLRASVSLTPSLEYKTQFDVRLVKFHATLLVQSACREVSSSVSSPNWTRKDFAHEIPPDCLVLFPNFSFISDSFFF